MFDFPIIDSHFHIWDIDILRYPWLDSRGILNQSYSLAQYKEAMDKWNIEGSIYVEVTSTDYVKEVEYVTEQMKSNGQIKGIISWCPLEKTDIIEEELKRLIKNPMVKGVRRMLKKAGNPKLCLDPGFIEGMRLLPKYNLVYDMGIIPELMDNVYEMMKVCPDTKIVLEHCAEPDIKGHGFDYWAERMEKMAKLPNVYCKLSGFLTKADYENWTIEDLRPYMEHTIKTFGYDKVMFGSDWPPVVQVSNLKTWLDICEEVFKDETEENLRKIFRENAIKFYQLDV